MASTCEAPYRQRMLTYSFEIQANSKPSAASSIAPRLLECATQGAAIAQAELLAKTLRPGHVAKLTGPDGAILWMGAPDERR